MKFCSQNTKFCYSRKYLSSFPRSVLAHTQTIVTEFLIPVSAATLPTTKDNIREKAGNKQNMLCNNTRLQNIFLDLADTDIPPFKTTLVEIDFHCWIVGLL